MSRNIIREIPPPIRLAPSNKQSPHHLTSLGSGWSVERNISTSVSSSTTDHGDERETNSRPLSLFAYCVKALYPRLNDIVDLERSWTRRSYESPRIREAIIDLFPDIPRHLLESSRTEKTLTSEPDGEAVTNVLVPTPNDANKEYKQKKRSKQAEFDAPTFHIHPHLWALVNLLVIPATLPPGLRILNLALSDSLLPSIQFASCLSSQTLALLTCLSLNSSALRQQLTDDSLIHLRPLICLTLLDLARTPITSKGLKRLALSMRSSQGAGIGPRKLQVLYLNGTFVDDDILGENGIGVFPLLFAVDLRDTGCNEAAIAKYQASWNKSSHSPQCFLSPTPLSTVMNNISEAISVSGEKTKTEQQDHAFLFIRTISERERWPSAVISSEERKERDKKLRLQTSGVVVLTTDDAILGNVREEGGTSEEGSAKANFHANRSHHDLYDDHNVGSSDRWKRSSLSIPYTLSYSEDSIIDSNYILLQDPPIEGKGILSRKFTILPPSSSKGSNADTALFSQSLATQPAPKRRRVEETYSVKRFKGATMSQIFGTNKSLSSRRL